MQEMTPRQEEEGYSGRRDSGGVWFLYKIEDLKKFLTQNQNSLGTRQVVFLLLDYLNCSSEECHTPV